MSITNDAIKYLRDNGIRVVDRRGKALGGNNHNRSLSGLRRGGFHWDGVSGGTIEGHERYWRDHHKWRDGGYTTFIDDAGTVFMNYDFEKRTNGVGNHNTPTLNVCYAGTYSNPMNDKQRRAAKIFWTFVVNDKRTNINSFNDIWGHNEFPGHSSNSCPGINMNDFRAYLKEDSVKVSTQSKPAPAKKVATKKTHKVTADGYLGPETVKALQHYFGLVVDGEMWGQYHGNQATKAFNQRAVKYGKGGSPVVKALQRKIGASPVDGYFGKETTRKLQKYLGTPVDGIISRPSTVIRELQKRLKYGTF